MVRGYVCAKRLFPPFNRDTRVQNKFDCSISESSVSPVLHRAPALCHSPYILGPLLHGAYLVGQQMLVPVQLDRGAWCRGDC